MVLALKNPTKKKATTKPRDAATLILVRFDGPAPRILMGQRHEAHAFMPNKYVFPGGRCEAADGRLPVVNEGDSGHPAETQAADAGQGPAIARRAAFSLRRSGKLMRKPGCWWGGQRSMMRLISPGSSISPGPLPLRGGAAVLIPAFSWPMPDMVSNLDQPHPLETDEIIADQLGNPWRRPWGSICPQ